MGNKSYLTSSRAIKRRIPNLTIRFFCFNRTYLDTIALIMPPTLVRPQTFDPLQNPDSASPAVRKDKSSSCESCPRAETAKTALSRNLTSWFEYIRCSNTREQNPIYSLVEVLFEYLVFYSANIVQRFKPLIFKDFDKSNSGCYTLSCFRIGLSSGVSPDVYTPRLIGKTESLQEER